MKLKLGMKINLIIFSITILLSLTIAIVVYSEITAGIKEFAVEKAKGDLTLAYNYIDAKYPGNWEIKDGKLLKGSTVMNEYFELVDKIGRDTGDTVTIFQNGTRIATNVMVEGERAIGTQASQEVVEIVLNRGENFYGEANVAGNQYQTAYMPILDASDERIGILYVGTSQNVINSILSEIMTKFFIILAIVILIGFAITFTFTKKLNNRLSVVAATVIKAGEGDFSTKLNDKAGDEITDLSNGINRMIDQLKDMINEVLKTTEQVAASSEQLTASAEQTSKATESITESIQEVAGSAELSNSRLMDSAIALKEVSTGVHSIAEDASTIAEVSSQSTLVAQEGGLFVEKTVNQINAISQSVDESNQTIKLLDKRSKEIGQIIVVISEIANQTNLLALNAAIEAARAGEHGKGFAVVASEVRKLAEQSQQSASSISQLIIEIQKDMLISRNSMNQVTIDVKEGLRVVQQTEGNFKEIMKCMQKRSKQMDNMAATTEEMSASVEEVTNTISDITRVMNSTSGSKQTIAAAAEEQLASMEEVTASANSLAQLGDQLQQLVLKFKV